MAKSNEALQPDIDNLKTFTDKSNEAYKNELKLYEDFFKKITHHASTHRQISINNLNEIEERLKALKASTKDIKNSLFYHDEYSIVERQEIIASTESLVQKQNLDFLEYHFNDKNELLSSIDYLNKAMFQTKTTFFDEYERQYLSVILEHDQFYEFFMNATSSIHQALDEHQKDISSLFTKLDDEIKKMDDSISEIIKKKNRSISLSNHFFEDKMKHYVDNQLLFSAQSDPTSIDIQALVSDKFQQFELFQEYALEEDQKYVSYIRQEYTSLFEKVLKRQLARKSNMMTDTLSFFDNPEAQLNKYKENILEAHKTKNQQKLKENVRTFQKAKKYKKYYHQLELKSKKILKKVEFEKINLLLAYRKHSYLTLSNLNQYLDLFTSLMTIDPFLAQVIGDYSSKIIKDELNHLSILQANKELKSNINYDIESIKIKNKINNVELQLTHEVKKQLVLQEIDLLKTVSILYQQIYSHKASIFHKQLSVKKDSLQINKIQQAINAHLLYLHQSSNISREIESKFIENAITQIRSQETHHIHVSEAASKIKLKLKEFDIKALHFKTLLENETAFLVEQSSRVSEETDIHHTFILTTYENQMRFSKEQIDLAETEYRLRVEALNNTIQEEKSYFEDLIRNKIKKYELLIKQEDNNYQAKLYQNRHLLSETTDHKIHKILDKEAKKFQTTYTSFKSKMRKELEKDDLIESAKRRMRELDEEFIDAMDDALKLKEETISQMSSLYDDAFEHYQVLKPFLENKMNVLDPDFYYQLERINKRYLYKLKLAEAQLDNETETLIDDYRKIYFEELPSENIQNYDLILDNLHSARENAENDYANKLQFIESEYLTESNNIDIVGKQFDNNLDLMIKAQNERFAQSEKELSAEVTVLEENYRVAKLSLNDKLEANVKKYMDEYLMALANNQKFITSLSTDFDKLLISYKPYIKMLKKDKRVQAIFNTNHKKNKHITKTALKEIKLATKKFNMIEKKHNA